MPAARLNFGRLPYLGAFGLATDRVAILPAGIQKVNEARVSEVLGVEVARTNIGRSPLVGALAAGNSNGLVATGMLETHEEESLRQIGLMVERLPGKRTAVGNMVLANDKGALVNQDLPEDSLELIREVLGVPVERGTVAGLKNVGAAAVATNRGVLTHPDISKEELELVERVLGVPVEVGTACGGVKYVGICVIANSSGALAGEMTTGPELGRIESALGFI